MSANGQKRRLKNKSERNRQEIKTPWPKNPRAQSDNRSHDCREKTKRRNDEKLSIHQEGQV